MQLKIFKSKVIEDNQDYRGKPVDVKLKDLVFYMQRDPRLRRSKMLYQTLLFDSKATTN